MTEKLSDQESEDDLGPITWCNNPNMEMVTQMLCQKGYNPSSLSMTSFTRYTLNQPMSKSLSKCRCKQQEIVVTKEDVLHNCKCVFQVLGPIPPEREVIYETKSHQHHLRYSRKKARPIRIPAGYKFIALKSNTGTGKNHQLKVLLRALLHGDYNMYHTRDDESELEHISKRMGEDPGSLLLGARRTYDIEMTRKLSNLGAMMDKDMNEVEGDVPIWVLQWHSIWKYEKRYPKILVMDEANLLQQCYTDRLNLKFQQLNQEMQEDFVKEADIVIVMDATLTQDTIDVISKMDPKGKWFVQENMYKSNHGSNARNHISISSIINQCVKDIMMGLVVAIGSGGKKKLNKFREKVLELLPKNCEVKHRTIVSTTPGKERAFEEGLDKNLGRNFTMFLYNGTAGVGVEYTLDHVDKRYLLVNYNQIPADGYLQALGRIRNPKNTTVEMFIEQKQRKKEKSLPVTREEVLREIEKERKSNEYIKTYFKPHRDPTTKTRQWSPHKPWVLEALVSNKMQRNKSMNNMTGELFYLLQATGYTIIDNVEEQSPVIEEERGCEGISLDSDEIPTLSIEQQNLIELEVNAMSVNEQLELNLRYWERGPPTTREDSLRRKYVRFRIDFPECSATIEQFKVIEEIRPQLFRIACVEKLHHNALNNYLIREKRSDRLEFILDTLTAFRIVFGTLLGIKDKEEVMQLGLPSKIEGHQIHENINEVLLELRKTGIGKKLGIQMKSHNKLKSFLNSDRFTEPKPDEVNGIIPGLLGVINRFMKDCFLCEYVALENDRYKVKGKKYRTWKLSPHVLPNGDHITKVAYNSLMCTDTDYPGQPSVAIPVVPMLED
jgi:hypothetical protein